MDQLSYVRVPPRVQEPDAARDRPSASQGMKHSSLFERHHRFSTLWRVLKKNHTLLNIVFVRGEVVTRRARIFKLGAEQRPAAVTTFERF